MSKEPEWLRKVNECHKRLDELERRTEVEKQAEQLICEGKYAEAIELLNTID